MAGHMQDWLGPCIEKDLRKAVEWKRKSATNQTSPRRPSQTGIGEVPVQDDSEFSNIFRDDGSNMTIQCDHVKHEQKAVQIIEVYKHPTWITFRLSDGYTSVKARITDTAQEVLREKDDREASELVNGMILSIPKFEIKATSLGKPNERVTMSVQYARMVSSMRGSAYGSPKDIHQRPKVQEGLIALKELSRLAKTGISENQKAILAAPSTQLPITQLFPYANVDSQGFATQLATRHPVQARDTRGAVNLAAPVTLNRNDSARSNIGSRPNRGDSSAATINPMDLLSKLPEHPGRHALPVNGRSRLFDEAASRIRGDDSSAGRSPRVARSPRISVDLTHDDKAEGYPNVAAPTSQRNKTQAKQRSPEHTSPRPQPTSGSSWEVPGDPLHAATIKGAIEDSPPKTLNDTEDETTLPSPKRPGRQKTLASNPWHGISVMKRSHMIVPEDQMSLLNRHDAWNPPAPGQRFPVPNVPLTVLESLQRDISVRGKKGVDQDKSQVNAKAASSLNPSEESDSDSESLKTPAESPLEQAFPWSSSPAQRLNYDGLPPDSSGMVHNPKLADDGTDADKHADEDGDIDMLPPDSPAKKITATGLGSVRSSPPVEICSGHRHAQDPVRTSQLFSSAVHPQATQKAGQRMLNMTLNLPDSTLSSSNFESPGKVQVKASAGINTSASKAIASTYTPQFQSAQPQPSMMYVDGATMSDSPQFTSDDDRLAAEQLHEELKASTQDHTVINGLDNHSQRTAVSPPLISRTDPGDEGKAAVDSIAKYGTPAQILGKRPPASPASPNSRQRKSRFGFSQEDAVSQDPSNRIPDQRRDFLLNRKQSRNPAYGRTSDINQSSPRTAQQAEELSHTHQNTQTDSGVPTGPKRAARSSDQRFDYEEGDASPPGRPQMAANANGKQNNMETIYQEFRSAYPAYTANLKHFDNLMSTLQRLHVEHHFHPFLWDDFVVQHKLAYGPYTQEKIDEAEEPMPYPLFYGNRCPRPRFVLGVLTLEKLESVWSVQPASASPPVIKQHADDRMEHRNHGAPPDRKDKARKPHSPRAGNQSRRSSNPQPPPSASRHLKKGSTVLSTGWGMQSNTPRHQSSAPRRPQQENSRVSQSTPMHPPAPSPPRSTYVPPLPSTTPSKPPTENTPHVKRSLPWSTDVSSNKRLSTESTRSANSRDAPKREYERFNREYNELSSFKHDLGVSEDEEDGERLLPRPRQINILKDWNLD